MASRRTKTEQGAYQKYGKPLLYGCAAGLAATLVCLLLMAVVMTLVDIPQSAVEPMAVFAAGLGAFVAGNVSSRLVPGRGFFWAAACGLVLFLMNFFAGIAVLSEGVGLLALLKLLVMFVFSSAGGLFGTSRRYARRR